MPYLFHDRALSLRATAGVEPGFALAVAILGTTLTMLVLTAIVG